MKPLERIQNGLAKPLSRIPKRASLSDMMSDVRPTNELVRPVDHENAKAFAIMAVPDQIADEERRLVRRQSEVFQRLASGVDLAGVEVHPVGSVALTFLATTCSGQTMTSHTTPCMLIA